MPDEKRSKLSRRGFLKSTAVGAAAVGALVAAPTILKVTENAVAAPVSDPAMPLVAYVRNAARAEVVVMWGTNEIVARDYALVSRLSTYTKV